MWEFRDFIVFVFKRGFVGFFLVSMMIVFFIVKEVWRGIYFYYWKGSYFVVEGI